MQFNPPPGWPRPPAGWLPPDGWKPDPSWPPPPSGWQFWLSDPTATPDRGRDSDSTRPMPVESPSSPEPEHDERSLPTLSALPAEAKCSALLARIAELEAELAAARATPDGAFVDLDDQRVLQDVGIYRYHHPLEDAAAYKDRQRLLESEMDGII